jgi:DNA-binding transcriptional ArsR family regulator
MKRPFSALQELGDSTRLSVFLAIIGRRKNVSQIVLELGLAQPQVSYHLRKLKDAGLAVEEKDGRWVWYQANWDAADRNVRGLIELLARWAEDEGAIEHADAEPELVGVEPVRQRSRGAGIMKRSGTGRAGAAPAQAPKRPGRPDARPNVERPEAKEDELDDFLL